MKKLLPAAERAAEAYLGPLQVAILASVSRSKEPLNAVGIWKELKTSYKSSITSGGVYTVLARLSGRGLLSESREKKSSGKGRPKVYYRITAAGRKELSAQISRIERQAATLSALTV